jgi:hypothetical protein
MRQLTLVSLAILELTVVISGPVLISEKAMTENERHLNQTSALAQEFETQSEPERLREAAEALANVALAPEHDLKTRIQVRTKCLKLWLHLLELLDRSLDPNFDPSDVPERLVQPPPLPDGEVLRPGADPSRIPDSHARAEYEKAIKANRAKAKRYRMQVQLRPLNDQLTTEAESFIRNAYSPAAPDQKELSAAISEVKDPMRRAQLSNLLNPAPSH